MLSAAGCKQILGLHERTESISTDGGDAPKAAQGKCGSLKYPSESCATCMDTSCCAEASACHQNESCDPAYDCLNSCGDDGACRARCAAFYARTDTLLGLTSCREEKCAAECGLSCGGFGYSVPGCDQCVKSTCCAAASACAKNLECLKLDLCRTNCLYGSTTCPAECDAQYPLGTTDYAPWLVCLQNDCAAACQTGRGWQCLDAPFFWPKPKALGQITFSVTVVDLLSEQPYAGATVKACQRIDLLCANPLDETTADATGLVSLTVPSGSIGFDGYLDITGGDNGAGSTIFPAMWYPVPPVIAGGWRGTVQFVSTADLPILGAATGAEIDPTRGHFAANADDCNFSPAGGVSFTADSADDKTKSFYFLQGLPNISATATDPANPIGGFVNLPAKLVLIRAFSAIAGGKKMGEASYGIRAATFTTSSFPPAPGR
jgi:hypothetical protein